jgi:hypothetical protein
LLNVHVLSCRSRCVQLTFVGFFQASMCWSCTCFRDYSSSRYEPVKPSSWNIMKITVFWNVTLFSLVNVYRRFGGTGYLHI